MPLVIFIDALNRRLTGGTVAQKVCHLAMHGCHWTPFGISGSSVPDQLALDAVLIICEEETDKV